MAIITQTQRQDARKTPLHLNKQQPRPSKYPFFVAHVIQELVKTYGEDVVRRGGLKVYTALEPEVQEAATRAVRNGVAGAPRYSHVTNGAMACIDVPSSEVLAIVGGVDFKKSQFNNATQARRAAGSQFKPFVYLTGFRLGYYTPKSRIVDRPIHFGRWHPKNWDGRYMGPLTIRQALTLSRNTPTVQIGMRVGVDEVIKTARLAGVTTPIDRNYSSFLGSSGIPAIEMAGAFSTFARGGIRMKPTAIRRVENVLGKPLKLNRPLARQVFNPNAVAMLNSILVDVVEKGTGKHARIEDRQVAGKTGTTDKVRDVWFTGYTPDMVATVWLGNDKYVPLKGVFSSNAAKVWHAFANDYYKIRKVSPSKFEAPQNQRVRKNGVMVLHLSPSLPPEDIPAPTVEASSQALDGRARYETFEIHDLQPQIPQGPPPPNPSPAVQPPPAQPPAKRPATSSPRQPQPKPAAPVQQAPKASPSNPPTPPPAPVPPSAPSE